MLSLLQVLPDWRVGGDAGTHTARIIPTAPALPHVSRFCMSLYFFWLLLLKKKKKIAYVS